ncbi:NAD-dependent epimerase/dehydratase family protein [Halosquirtibacter laminarini]|uniref:NAD-dependent epimerase/dehydratase family protein n=1 Tax=Halosquirtibacter laminarini TaxID=3374600 RepID=A0AC61NR12_9BACT|nr:NAD-dependent epimerase/dehydratase family protein [Prolixibacteraceae bacterium]
MILITGGTGMLGAHLLLSLSKGDDRIIATKRKSSDLTSVKNIFNFFEPKEAETLFKKIEWVDADINNPSRLREVMKGVVIVYHTAAIVSFSKKDEKEMILNNREGTANLIDIAIENKVKKFCHVSSVAALEKISDKKFTDEENYWKSDKDKNAYAISKYQSEMEVWRGHEMGLPIVIINPSVILGSGNWQKGSPRFFSTIAKRIYFYTEGGTGFVDVKDCIEAMVQLTSDKNWNEVKGQKFVLNGYNLPYKAIFDNIAKELHVVAPKWKITTSGMKLAYWIEAVLSRLCRRTPKLTKATLKSACNRSYYNGNRIETKIGLQYTPIEQTIHRIAKQYIQEHS